MKILKIKLFVLCGLLILGVSLLTQLVHATPIEPPTLDYAEFRYDPYPWGPNTITVYFYHESYVTMYIDLHDYNDDIVKTWVVNRYTREGFLTYSASYDGIWRVYCRWSRYNYVTDEAFDQFSFNINDPDSGQNNLGSDWARHPHDWSIYDQAMSILNYNTNLDAYTAAQMIQSYVYQHFDHFGATDYSFRSDTALQFDVETTGKYHGVCRSDAVILTAYARSLGIPARIIYLGMKQDYSIEIDPHYFAEFYIPSAPSAYKWITVDGDNNYGWFDQPAANQLISLIWPPGRGSRWHIATMQFITSIPYGGIMDDIPAGCSEYYANYNLYYKNTL